jgi:hypothetical protein
MYFGGEAKSYTGSGDSLKKYELGDLPDRWHVESKAK